MEEKELMQKLLKEYKIEEEKQFIILKKENAMVVKLLKIQAEL